jgi:uncharacterized protein
MPNRLAAERSPYLLQHANNPVDWYPWGDEAFARARQEDRPIFLSVGYSTCHWCHVMEHESFESDEIARVLNDHFISIKVDREERPDVDRVYMMFVQATTGAGGWPMSVWLTPDRKPFLGGTYFPPSARWGRPGFVDVLLHIARLWRDDRPRLLASAESTVAQLQSFASSLQDEQAATEARSVAGEETLEDGLNAFARAFDRRFAGFGDAPKFPRPAELIFLLREHARTGSVPAREMALRTLDAMASGGICDHVGGGFHRYAVDARWRVPHFEKMLYDQAQLTLAFVEAAQASGDQQYAAVAEAMVAYVARDLRSAEGGFLSAEDADSVPPEHAGDESARKSEGAFYLWSEDEVNAVLDPAASAIVRARFGIEPAGNVLDDPQGEFGAKNILYVAMALDDVATRVRKPKDEVARLLAEATAQLFAVRASRPRPHLDDKVLTAWNGLMIAAAARAARVLQPGGRRFEGEPDCLALADGAAHFVLTHLWDEPHRVMRRRYREGDAAIEGYCEDYAFFIWGLLELFQASGEPEWLHWAKRLQERQDELFWDATGAGWFSTTGEDPSVLVRLKEDYDGAEPAASSVSVANLIVLGHLLGDADALEKVERTLARGGPHFGRTARAVPFMLSNLSTFHAGMRQVVIIGAGGSEKVRSLLEAAASVYQPFTTVIPVNVTDQARLAELLPLVASMTMTDGEPTAYVCRNFACDEPTTSPARLVELLRSPVAGLVSRPASR